MRTESGSAENDEQLRDLMRQAQNGNSYAYEQLIDEMYAILHKLVASKLRSTTDDVVQEIIITVHKIRHTYDPQRPFMPWLAAIAYRRIADDKRQYWREQKRVRALTDDLCFSSKQSSSEERLYEALAQLPERQRQILNLLKLQGFSLKEIASKLSLSADVVKVSAHRGYNQLRKLLTEAADEI